ncbi:MAG: LacI family DNA-binding transcriptional regulator [Armatimonadota bacterium]
MATTVYDIARVAGVSRTTVLKALWDRDKISPQTRAKVLKIAAEMNYRPNHIARSLSLGNSGLVGMLADSRDGAVFQNFIPPIQQALRKAGYAMLFYSYGGDSDSEHVCIEELISKRVVGSIIVPGSLGSDCKSYSELMNAGIRVVIMDREVEDLETPQVVSDQYSSGRLATEHLISLGHKRIVYLAIPETSHTGRERARGFRDAMAAGGIAVTKSSIVEVDYSPESGARATTRLLKRKDPPTAIVVRHDNVAIGVMNAVFAAGLSVPDDVSIVGHANNPFTDSLRVPLTTVENQRTKMAQKAVDSLLDMLANRPVKMGVDHVEVRLVIRSSCAPPIV